MSYYRHGPFRPSGPGLSFGAPRVTPYIKLIMIVSAGIWLVQYVLLQTGVDLGPLLGLVPARVIRGWLWQPVTYMFLHSPLGPFHLLFNMLMLWMFGSELERHWGSRALLRFYLVCGCGAGLAATLFGLAVPGLSGVPTVGASGAVFGLFMAYGMVFSERTVLFMLIFPMKARTMAIVMFALTFFYTWSQPYGGVSHIAHLGGAVVGFLYLKRVWRWGEFYRDLRWKIRRRRFRVMPPREEEPPDRWVN